MKIKKVSIIIPVYNNEKFLDKCLCSVINQTLNDIEIIVINDGSSDSSLAILKNYARENSNITILEQSNAGQAAAINRGLEAASGEYIAFVDADDYIEPDMLEILYHEAKSSNLDLVICNWCRVDTDGRILSYNDHANFDNKLLDRNEVIQEFLLNNKELIEGFSWNKLIKRDLFMEYSIRYPNIRFEDIPAIFKILTKVNTCKYINKRLYYYVQHNASITGSKSEINIKGFIKAVEMINEILVEEKLISEFKEDYFLYRTNCLLSEYISSIDVIKNSAELTRIFEVILQTITLNKLLKCKKTIDIKLLVKVVLYKVRLLPLFLMVHQKVRQYSVHNQ